ncbi:threonine dehydrogenase-like Zn-dependent dehydrogenase [Herbihabitans rhizosphaerae]|uniref:Threonine dehydrogenase-like Zn-dependent dehydrogenase n=1 Tax=Herbihabitans rhizosphaerae TaxID=1872711 RepID=A0A4Q7KDB4_9PSEU|nr:zinc-binding dehydrogenase [Herbihabitans rhizosphaerae]RZS31204.1 threonine dehydrogenase-like Zn-dependent dehydrogenase [Herbihabitans rhizosphaerae]
MRAVTCEKARLEVAELPDPRPEKGHLLIEVERCGICGSDLHARHHADELADVASEAGYDGFMRSDHRVIMGHEFCGEVVERGPGCRAIKPGTRVVAMPLLRRADGVHQIGLSTAAPGGYAERMLVQESLAFPVPNGLSSEVAALTEPMAVGWHAVRRGDVGKKQVAVVIGCGPIGLAVISLLKANGVRTVIASDFSPGRRALATACGADVVVDPAEDSPFASAADHGHVVSASALLDLAVSSMSKLRRLPVPWEHVWRIAERFGATTPKHPVVFECVGVPGVLDQIITSAPLFSRVVVVGVCMEPDRIRPALAITKEIDLRFVLGYTPIEFRDTLHMLADGEIDATPLITDTVGLDGVHDAFGTLADPGAHAKILIDPRAGR